jgi:hypothetical protein
MDVYSPALGAAMLATTASLGAGFLPRRTKVAVACGASALLLLAVAGTSHVLVGHPPGSASALGFAAFLREHLAFAVTAVLAVGSLVLAAASAGRAGDRG